MWPMQSANTVPSRLNSIRSARTDYDRWSQYTADDAYSNYEYDYDDDRSPQEDLADLVSRSQNVLSGLKKDSDAQSCYGFDDPDASEYEYEYESDYGQGSKPIGRYPSRRFGSRASRMSRRVPYGGQQQQSSRELTVPEPVATAAPGIGAARRLPSVRQNSVRRVVRMSSTASRSGRPIRQPSQGGGMGRKGTMRRGLSTRQPQLSIAKEEDEEDSFEASLARLSASGLTTVPAQQHSQQQQQQQQQRQQQRSFTTAMSTLNMNSSNGPTRSGPTNTSSSVAMGVNNNYMTINLSDEKSLAYGGGPAGSGTGEMVEIPIRDDTGSIGAYNRTDSMHSDNALPPYAPAVGPGGPPVCGGGGGGGGAYPDGQRGLPGDTPDEEGMMAHGLRLVSIVLALSLAVFVVGMDVNIVSTAIPHITKDFNSLGDIAWYGSSFLMATCAFQILFGRLYTHFSPKFVFAAALAIFEVGSLIAALSPNSIVLIIGRSVQGVGCAGILSGALIIGSLIVPLSKRSLLGGIIGATEGVAMISAPMIGGIFTDRLHWRWCFYINLPIGAVVISIVLLCLRLPPQMQPAPDMTLPADQIPSSPLTFTQKAVFLSQKLDLLGTALLIPSIVSVLLALQWGGKKYEWNSLGVICLFVISGIFLGIFCYFQHQKQDLAMVPPRIFKQRTVLSGFWFMLCTSSALVVMAYFLPLWFQVILNVTPSNSGIRMLPMLIGVIVAVLLSGGLVSALGHYAPFMILGTLLMSVGAGLLSSWTPSSSNTLLIIYPAIFGAGIGISFQQPIIAAQTVLSDEDIPIGTSVIVFGQSIGAAIVLSIAETVFSNRLAVNIREKVGLSLSTHDLVDGGAAAVIQNVIKAGGSLSELMQAYNKSITQAFYVAVAMAGLSIFGALFIEWRNVKQEEQRRKDEAELLKAEKSHGPYPSGQAPNLAYNVDQGALAQQQQQYNEQQMNAPQPYDQARTQSPYGQNQQFQATMTGPTNYGPPPGPSAYEMQQQYPPQGLGLNSSYYNSSQSPAPTYREKPPIEC